MGQFLPLADAAGNDYLPATAQSRRAPAKYKAPSGHDTGNLPVLVEVLQLPFL